MGRKSKNLNIIAGSGLIIIIFFFINRYYNFVNIDSTVSGTLFTLLPGFIITSICIYVTAETRGVGKLGGALGTGIGLCYLIYSADAQGLITSRMLSGLTIPQLQIWIMMIATLAGSIIYAT